MRADRRTPRGTSLYLHPGNSADCTVPGNIGFLKEALVSPDSYFGIGLSREFRHYVCHEMFRLLLGAIKEGRGAKA